MLSLPLFQLGDTQTTLGSLLLVALVVVGTILLGRIVRQALQRRFTKAYGDAEDHSVYGFIAQLLVWFIGFEIALHLLGLDLSSILAAGGFLAIGAGFAAKNIIENFLSGGILKLERTIRPGDIIIVDGQWLVIDRIGVRATYAETYEGEQIVIPNTTIAQAKVVNLTRQDRMFRLDFNVGVAYESDLELVRKTLEETIEKLDWKSKGQSSWVRLTEFGESSVKYRIVVWIDDVDEYSVRKQDLLEAVWWALKANDITIAYPQMDVHLDRQPADSVPQPEP